MVARNRRDACSLYCVSHGYIEAKVSPSLADEQGADGASGLLVVWLKSLSN